jgi:tRNA uridine 5-carbamoylmethylation protein Kti12
MFYLSALSYGKGYVADPITFSSGDWNESTFHTFRQQNMHTVATHIESVATTIRNREETPSVVIIDDLMYLRSMRREIYVMARDHHVPLLVVWVKADINVALDRNSHREGRARIKEETMRRICEQLQPPDASFIFDRVHMVIDNNSTSDRYDALLTSPLYTGDA